MTGAVFAVGDYYQRAPSPVAVVAFLIFGNVFGSQINRIDNCWLTSFNIQIVQRVDLQVLGGGKVLQRFNLVTADEAHQERLVSGLVAIDDGFTGVNHCLNLGS